MRSCFWMDICEACTYLCCLCLSLSVRVLLAVSSFFMLRNCFKILWNSWSYSSTLAYLVDANNGRSSTVVALNSVFRGVFAFVAIEITVPLQVCTAFRCYALFSYTFTSRILLGMVCIFSRLERRVTVDFYLYY